MGASWGGARGEVKRPTYTRAGPQGPVLRLRHFDRELIGWEKEKERALTLPLVRYKEGEAGFEGLEAGGTTVRLVYSQARRGRVLGRPREGDERGTKREEFRFRRRPAR